MPNGKMHKINPKTGLKYPPKHLSNYKRAVKLEEGLIMARLRAEMKFKKGKGALEKSITDHIGKMVDRVEPVEAFIMAGLAYLSYETFKTVQPAVPAIAGYWVEDTSSGKSGAVGYRYWVPEVPAQSEKIIHNPANALIGPIGYKLATTDGIPSQVAGLAILSALGIAYLTPAVILTATQEGANLICTELEKWADSIVKSLGLGL